MSCCSWCGDEEPVGPDMIGKVQFFLPSSDDRSFEVVLCAECHENLEAEPNDHGCAVFCYLCTIRHTKAYMDVRPFQSTNRTVHNTRLLTLRNSCNATRLQSKIGSKSCATTLLSSFANPFLQQYQPRIENFNASLLFILFFLKKNKKNAQIMTIALPFLWRVEMIFSFHILTPDFLP